MNVQDRVTSLKAEAAVAFETNERAAQLASIMLDVLKSIAEKAWKPQFGDVLGASAIHLASLMASTVTQKRAEDFQPSDDEQREEFRRYVKMLRDTADLADALFDNKEKLN